MVSRPRIVIAGTHSGVGKTTVAVGVMAALARRGVPVQPFKVGPDYIDPSYHAMATGRVSRNLDTWLLTPSQVRAVFAGAAAERLAVIEGVMGLFDGRSSRNQQGSTAELARQLQAPVVLVVDASHMAGSVAALVRGYARFDPRVRIAGVICNQVSERHFQLLRESLRAFTRIPVLGYLPINAEFAVPERHLGLVPAQEHGRAAWLDRLAAQMERSIDVERVVRLARAAPKLSGAADVWPPAPQPPLVRIGLARDEAFHFYYQENLELLRAAGAELVEFSPLRDAQLPEQLDGLYLGGGFPEMFAGQLADNVRLRRQMRAVIADGLPTYAECGGLMYLTRALRDQAGTSHAMVGALPGAVRMTDRLQHFGYVTVRPARRTVLAGPRDAAKGHEFHYSMWERPASALRSAYRVANARRESRTEGFAQGNVLASYIHVHFITNPRWAYGFVAAAQRWKADRVRRSGSAVRRSVHVREACANQALPRNCNPALQARRSGSMSVVTRKR